MRYEELPVAIDRSRIAGAVRNILCELQKVQSTKDWSAQHLAEKLASSGAGGHDVTANAIKLFMIKYDKDKGINKKNKVLPRLYDFIRDNLGSFPDKVKLFASESFYEVDPHLLSEEEAQRIQGLKRDAANEAYLKLMNVSSEEIGLLCRRLTGQFFLLRKSSDDCDAVIKSEIDFVSDQNQKILTVRHRTKDRSGEERFSEGLLVPATENIYCIMQTKNYDDMEMIVFHKNSGEGVINKAMGLITTTSLKRIALSSRMALVRRSPESEKIPDRVSILAAEAERDGYISKEILPILGKVDAIEAPD